VIEIWLLGDETIAIDGQPVARDVLAESLKQAIGERTDLTVTILAEKGSKTQALIAAIEAARQSGAKNVGTARVERIAR
ncbi:MAG: ExbD/TolR family protein, partial [Parvibaculum sp.]